MTSIREVLNTVENADPEKRGLRNQVPRIASLPCSCYNKMETSPNIKSILEISPFVKSTRCVPTRERRRAMTEVPSDQPVSQRRKRRDAIENRERILHVARQLFATQGVEATSMNEIAQVAQVGPGTLYRCFAHKGALGEALLTEAITAFWKQVDATLFPDAPGSALSQLDWFLDALLRMTETHLSLFTLVMELAESPHHKAYQNPFYTALHQRIRQLLAKAVAQGETRDLDVSFTADAILAAIMPSLYEFQQQTRNFSRERIMTGIRRLFIDGLRVHTQHTTAPGNEG
jgi:AcrR family transcriptional regulator